MQRKLTLVWGRKTIKSIVLSSILIIGYSLLLSGCGWRLRGSVTFPASVETMYVQGVARYSELGKALHAAFDGTNSRLVGSTAQAVAILHIQSNKAEKRVLTVDGSGRASEYEVAYLLQFKVTDLAGGDLVEIQNVRAKREYRFDPTNVLASDAEVARLQKEMVSVAVQQLLRRMAASLKKTSKTGAKSSLKKKLDTDEQPSLNTKSKTGTQSSKSGNLTK